MPAAGGAAGRSGRSRPGRCCSPRPAVAGWPASRCHRGSPPRHRSGRRAPRGARPRPAAARDRPPRECARPAEPGTPKEAATAPARAKDIWLASSASSIISRSVRRLPDRSSISSSGANTRPHERQPTLASRICTTPAAVSNRRSRVRLPLRAKSLITPQPGQPNGAGSSRTGSHFGPQTWSISRSCRSSRAAASAAAGSSSRIATAHASSCDQVSDSPSPGSSAVKARVVSGTATAPRIGCHHPNS